MARSHTGSPNQATMQQAMDLNAGTMNQQEEHLTAMSFKARELARQFEADLDLIGQETRAKISNQVLLVEFMPVRLVPAVDLSCSDNLRGEVPWMGIFSSQIVDRPDAGDHLTSMSEESCTTCAMTCTKVNLGSTPHSQRSNQT